MYVCGVTVYDYSHIGHARVRRVRRAVPAAHALGVRRGRTSQLPRRGRQDRANENAAKPRPFVWDRFVEAFPGRRHEFELFAAFARAASHGAHGRHHRHDEPFGGEGTHVRDWGRGRVLRGGLLTLIGALSGRKPEDNRAGEAIASPWTARKGTPRISRCGRRRSPASRRGRRPGARAGWHRERGAGRRSDVPRRRPADIRRRRDGPGAHHARRRPRGRRRLNGLAHASAAPLPTPASRSLSTGYRSVLKSFAEDVQEPREFLHHPRGDGAVPPDRARWMLLPRRGVPAARYTRRRWRRLPIGCSTRTRRLDATSVRQRLRRRRSRRMRMDLRRSFGKLKGAGRGRRRGVATAARACRILVEAGG